MNPEPNQIQLSKIVSSERRRSRLSQQQLAQSSRLALSTIKRIEEAKPCRLRLRSLLRLGRALGGRLRIEFAAMVPEEETEKKNRFAKQPNQRKRRPTPVEKGSGNVFADIGISNAVELSRKADRARQILRRATEVLGSRVAAERWMRRPITALGGRKPVSLIATEAGRKAISTILGRIKHGVYS
jgi:uncharacterized protein (DUF2384 family)